MANVTFDLDPVFVEYDGYNTETTVVTLSPVFRVAEPWPGSTQVLYVNKTWDTVAGDWVSWSTVAPDSSGLAYPGPGTFGVHTTDYRVQSRSFADLDA